MRWKKDTGSECSVSGCVDIGAHPNARIHYRPHAPCVECGGMTEDRRLRIDDVTLRRRRMPLCFQCNFITHAGSGDQAKLAQKRTQRDWELVSDPIQYGAIQEGRMPEQYAGPVRAAIRAFYLSTADVAVIPDATSADVQNSIGTLGLHDEMYAEIRGNETVIRRVKKLAKSRR